MAEKVLEAVAQTSSSVHHLWQTALSAHGLLEKERPSGLHKTSIYVCDTFGRIDKSVEAILAVIDDFGQHAPDVDRTAGSRAAQFVYEVKQIIRLLNSQLSTTDNQRVAIAFQYLRLFIETTRDPEYRQFWELIDTVTVGDVRNLISEFDSRHPSVFNEGIQAGNDHGQLKSRRLAISSVYTGLFIGMNDWRRILVGDLPGRLSTNNCYQATAKSPIELVRLAKGHFDWPEFDVPPQKTNSFVGLTRMRADSAELFKGSMPEQGSAPAYRNKHEAKGNSFACAEPKQEQMQGNFELIQMCIEKDHYLYQPALTVYPPEIGKYFRNGLSDHKLTWKMQHVVHDLGPVWARRMAALPFVCGDRVAFYHRAKPAQDDIEGKEGWLPLRCCKQTRIFQHHYHYGLLWNRTWNDDCVFTLCDQDVAASWRFGHMPANA